MLTFNYNRAFAPGRSALLLSKLASQQACRGAGQHVRCLTTNPSLMEEQQWLRRAEHSDSSGRNHPPSSYSKRDGYGSASSMLRRFDDRVRHERTSSHQFRRSPKNQNSWFSRGPGGPGYIRRDQSERKRPSYEGHDEILEGTSTAKKEYITEFAELATRGTVAPVLVDTITKRMGLKSMTPVQSQTLEEALEGVDLIAQARTGTGKTLAFLIPILQNLIKNEPSLGQPSKRRFEQDPDIRAVIISPTRELAEQIAAEASRLVSGTSIAVRTAVGGTGKSASMFKIMNQGCHLIVGTPGRLEDIFSDQTYNLDLSRVNTFVLDEGDRLLDDGFYPAIREIESFLPPTENRQNMLFSATVPKEVLDLAKTVLNPNHRFVQTIQKGEQQTHDKVPQTLVALNALENQLPAMFELVQKAQTDGERPFKALVFLNSTKETIFYQEAFHMLRRARDSPLGRDFPIFGIQSGLSQAARSTQANGFREASKGIMFSSDVSARGMDYPNVSHVIQLGLPRSRDYYIHRIGRTGRGEKAGEAWILLAPYELEEAQKMLRRLPLTMDDSLKSARADMSTEDEVDPEVQFVLETTRRGAAAVRQSTRSDAFRGSLGYNSWVRDKGDLAAQLRDQFTRSWGSDAPPALDPSVADRLGFRGAFPAEVRPRRFEESTEPQLRTSRRGYQGFDRFSSNSSEPRYPRDSSRRWSMV